MPDTVHNYIMLTVHASSNYIWDCFGSARDCYILHSRSFDTSFQKLKNSNHFLVLFESDKEDGDSARETLRYTTVESTTGPNILEFLEDKFFLTLE